MKNVKDEPIMISISEFDYKRVISVASGETNNLALSEDGFVYSWGAETYSIYSNDYNFCRPTKVDGPKDIVAIASAGYNSLALEKDGTVWAWGNNNIGQLGIGNFDKQKKAVKVSGLSNIVAISCGGEIDECFCMALADDGKVYSWGCNTSWELGDGTKINKNVPTLIDGLNDVKAISCGESEAMALLSDGTVYEWGTNYSTPTKNQSLSEIKSIANGTNNSLAIKSDGTLTSWLGTRHDILVSPKNISYCQLGDGSYYTGSITCDVVGLTKVKSIVCNKNYSVAITEDGKFYAWGKADYGYITYGDGSSYTYEPIEVIKPSDLTISAITVDNVYIDDFDPSKTDYQYKVPDEKIPEVKGWTLSSKNDGLVINVTQATSSTRTATIEVTSPNGTKRNYNVTFVN